MAEQDYKNAKLTKEQLKANLDLTLESGLLWDVGVAINRTNAVPLDYSTSVFPEGTETAEAAAERAAESSTAYPGQVLAVIEDKDVTPFVVQPNEHIRIITSLDEDSKPTVVEKATNVEQLAYRSYVDELTTDLKHTIGNLNSVMNFRGAFETFEAAQNFADATPDESIPGQGVAFVPGDIIIITGTAGAKTEHGADEDYALTGKPGMEYVCTGIDNQGKATWKELGFGSQVVTFIGGDTGLVLPETKTVGQGATTADTLVGYITESDKAITTFVGSAEGGADPKLKLPTNRPWKETTTSTTILDYIQESDKVLTDHIGTAAEDGTFSVPSTVPYDKNIPDAYKNPETVIEYIQTADQSIKNRLEGILDAERKARRLTDTDIAHFIGTDIAIETAEGETEGSTGGSLQRPAKYFDTTTDKDLAENTVFGYIQKSDTMLADLIGAKTSTDIKAELLPSDINAASDTIIEYIQDSDKTITDFIGTTAEAGEFSLPDTVPGNQSTSSTTVLDYVQESDKAITNFLGSESDTEFELPEKLPDTVTARQTETDTVLKYIKAADDNIIDVIGVEKAGQISSTDNVTSIVAFSAKTGETVAERLTDSNIQIENLNQFVGYTDDYEQSSLQERITGLDDLTEKASKNLIFEELDTPGQCKVVGVKEDCLETVIYVPRMDQHGNLVTTIASSAFASQPNIQRVILPESIKVIGNYAFSGSINLTEVNIPNGVTTIGDGAFLGCTQLKDLYIPASCVTLETNVFKGCTKLKQVIFDLYSQIKAIPSSTFEGCTSLEHVELPWMLSVIGITAFSGCTSLKTLYLGSDISVIAEGSFDDCTALSDIYCIGSGVGNIECENARAIFAKATIHFDTQPEKFTINKKIDRKSVEIHNKLDSIAIRTSEGEGSIKLNDIEHNRAVTRNSFAGGTGTIADETESQFVVGTYNARYTPMDTNSGGTDEETAEIKALFVVGNGTDDEHRSNALVVGTDGYTELLGLRVQGDIKYAGDLSFDNLKARSVKSDRLEINGEIIAEDIDLSAKAFQANSANFIEEAFAPTLTLGTDDDHIATTAFVQNAIDELKRILYESQPVEISNIQVRLKSAESNLALGTVQEVVDSVNPIRFNITVSTSAQIDPQKIRLYINNREITTNTDGNTLTWVKHPAGWDYTTSASEDAGGAVEYNLLNSCGTHTLRVTVPNLQNTQTTTKTTSIKVGRPIYFGSIPATDRNSPLQVVVDPYTSSLLTNTYGFTKEIRIDGSRTSSNPGQFLHYKISDSLDEERIFCYLVPRVLDAENKITFAMPDPTRDFCVALGLLQMNTKPVTVDGKDYILYYPEQNPGESLDVNITASLKDQVYTFS